jgi:hypothetical protein
MASAQRCAKDLEGLVLLADHRPVGGQRDGGLPLAPGGSPTATISASHVHRYASPASGQWHSTSTRTGPSALRATDDELLQRIPLIAASAANIEAGLRDRVHELRDRGMSWARIGAALGMTRQSAWERFARAT